MTLRKRSTYILFFLLVSMSSAWAENSKLALDSYYNHVFLGEKRTSNYLGPLDPRSRFNDAKGELVLLDDEFKEHYLDSYIQKEALSLEHFWSDSLIEKSTCPDEVLGENIEYIQYLYRLVSMSYLFEELRLNVKLSMSLGLDQKLCQLNYDNIFEKCNSRSSDMSKFKERVFGKFKNEFEKMAIEKLSKLEKESLLKKIQSTTSLELDPVMARVYSWCRENQKNCRDLKINDVKIALGEFCQKNISHIQNICNERDQFYGVNSIPLIIELIKSSNAYNLINQSGMGEECLIRYSKIFAHKENIDPYIVKQFPLIRSHLIKAQSRYKQGELFLPGSLKEFDMKGLSDFLTALKPPKKEEIIVVNNKPKAKPVIVPLPKPAPIVQKNEVVIVPEPVPEVVIPIVTEFEKGVLEIAKPQVTQYELQMDNFRDDYEFSRETISDMSGIIKKFQSRSALIDMKAFDLLGSDKAPVGLFFVKYLIDSENHQGLYNMISVLSDKFFVENDLEEVKGKPVFIHLKNDSSTKNRWQIILLKK